jgi:hypothetical protein
MASTAITGTDLTRLRSNQYIDDIAIHITPLVTVQTGTITAIPSLSPFVDITWDGSITGIELEQAVKITDGSTLKTWAVIRKEPVSSTLFISTTPLGSPGSATLIENAIAVGDTVTVYSHRPLWGLYSRIDEAEFFKQWDLAYTDQNEEPPPVSNSGPWQVAKLATGETTHTFTLPREGANSSFGFAGATISSYLWSLPTGVTLASGFALSDDVIDVEAESGYHLVSLTVTDSNANTHTAHLWLFVSDGTTGTSLSERYVIDEMSGSSTRQGTEISFRLTGDDLEDVLFPGAGIVVKQWAKFNDEDLTDGVFIDAFIGYIHPEGLEFAHDGEIGTAQVRMQSPVLIADSIVQPTQELSEVASPDGWAECSSSLSNPQFFLFYSIRWHTPSLLSMHDFDAPFTSPRIEFTTFNTESLGAAMKVPPIQIAGNIGSTADGKTIMRENPLYMSNTDRNALATVITWQAEDIDPDRGFNYLKRLGSQYAESLTGGFAYGGTKKAWLAGKRWHQGIGTTTLPNFWVTVAQGVTRIKEVAGHFLAEQNADIRDIPLNLNGLQDVIDPSLMIWCALTISSDFDPYGVGFSNKRLLPKVVSRTWVIDDDGVSLELTLETQPETFGQPGEEIPILNANTFLSGGWSSSTPVAFEPLQDGNSLGGAGLLIANDDNGKLAIAPNYFASTPSYNDLTPSVDNETVADFTLDWNSEYFAGNNATKPLGLYVLTISGTSLNIWRFNDVLNNPNTAVKLHTYTMNDSSCDTEARIEASDTTPTYVAVSWHDQTGVEFGYSNDGGSTWQAKANVGSTISDTANDNAPLGFAIDGNITIISAPDSTPEYGMYKATSVGGAFSEITNTERSVKPNPTAKIVPSGTTAYASVFGEPASSSSIGTVTFEPGGNTNYTLYGSTTVQASTGLSDNGLTGNTGSSARYAPGGTPSSATAGVKVNFGSSKTIYHMTVDVYSNVWFNSGEETDLVLYDSSGVEIDRMDGVNTYWNSPGWNRVYIPFYMLTDFPNTDTALEVRLEYSNGSTSSPDLRIDNLKFWDVTPDGTEVDFDGSFTDFTTGAVGNFTVSTPGSGGNPNGCYEMDKTASGGGGTSYAWIKVDLGSSKSVTGIKWDTRHDYSSSNTVSVELWVDSVQKSDIFFNGSPDITWKPYDHESEENMEDGTNAFPVSGQIIELRFYTFSSGAQIRIDNLIIEHSTGTTPTSLYSISPYTGSATWSDISPASGQAPERPHDLSIDIINSQTLDMVSGDSKNWYTSTDGGSSWSLSEASSDKRTFLTASDTLLAGGNGEIVISQDGGVSFQDKTGNLSTVWGSIGNIKRVQAL